MKVVGSNPSIVYSMDIFSHWFVLKITMFYLEKAENKQKETWNGLFYIRVKVVGGLSGQADKEGKTNAEVTYTNSK